MKPDFTYKTLESGSKLIRFDNLQDIFWFDNKDNNPRGIAMRYSWEPTIENYLETRNTLTERKKSIIRKAQKDMTLDKEFLKLIYKAKSSKREYKLNKFGGILSMPHYAANSEKVFKKGRPGAKKQTLNLAFQVGTCTRGNYTKGFVKILKTILMCQAMNINVNIDVFDSDTDAIGGKPGYIICNVAKSHEKLI